MLSEEKGAWSVVCDRCHTTLPLAASSEDEALRASRAAGWMDQARKGKPTRKWVSLCPACKPGDGSGQLGRSVGAGK